MCQTNVVPVRVSLSSSSEEVEVVLLVFLGLMLLWWLEIRSRNKTCDSWLHPSAAAHQDCKITERQKYINYTKKNYKNNNNEDFKWNKRKTGRINLSSDDTQHTVPSSQTSILCHFAFEWWNVNCLRCCCAMIEQVLTRLRLLFQIRSEIKRLKPQHTSRSIHGGRVWRWQKVKKG